MRIGIHRRDRQPGEQPDRGGDLCLHDIAHVAVDMGVEIRTNRLMDVTHPERLVVRENGLIMERRIQKKLPCGQDTKPLRESWVLPDKILVQLQAKTPGCESRGIVHEIVGIIPSPRRESHPARGGETPVR